MASGAPPAEGLAEVEEGRRRGRTVTFRTRVLDVPPTPLGLLPRRLVVEHHCDLCHQAVPTAGLVDHARAHGEPR